MNPTSDPRAWRIGPAKPRRLVAVLHGVGDSARGLAPVGEYLVRALPETAAVVLDGHEEWDGGPMGRQWFSYVDVTDANLVARVAAALPNLWGRLDRLVADEGLTHAELVLFGFSQGSMMTLSSAATGRRFAAGLAFAGRLGAPVSPPVAGSPRLFITHGTSDAVVPVEADRRSADALSKAGYEVTYQEVPGVGHDITEPQLRAAVRFVTQR